MSLSRRAWLQQSAMFTAAVGIPYWLQSTYTQGQEIKSPNARPRFGIIGNGGIAGSHGGSVPKLGDILATCDVDTNRAAAYNAKFAGGKAKTMQDYRELLDMKEIDNVVICTPDHWHVKVAIDALRAGKNVYCEKPLTLTIDEGRLLNKVVKETGRTLQVGTQQRSDDKFLTAVALAHAGRVGKLKTVTVAIGGAPKGNTFKTQTPPATLNWDRWLGQAPLVDFIPERCFGNFRWWYEYSGGKLTDWGAHHVDIAQWAIAPDGAAPVSFELLENVHPVPFENGYPTINNTYNTAVTFNVKCTFPNGVVMHIRNTGSDLGFDNGIMFDGENGRYFVNRGKLTGSPVDDLAKNPLPSDALSKLRGGREKMSHMQNFIAACNDGKPALSEPESHCRHLNTCHLAAIAMRLNRPLNWSAEKQQIVTASGEIDSVANAFQKREQRKGYEVV
jgi:predicted dehydrogenase